MMKRILVMASLLLMMCFSMPTNAQTQKQQDATAKAQKAAQKAAEKEAAKEAARAAKFAEKAAEKEAKIAAKEAEKAAKKAEKEAEKLQKKAEKAAEKSAKAAEKAAEKSAKKAEKAAEKAAKKAEKAAVKQAEKAEKARQKEILKAQEKAQKQQEKAAQKAAKKAQKAAETGAAVDAVTGATTPATEEPNFEVKKPELKSEADSLAYVFGVAQSNGLMNYLQNQLGVDSGYMEDFCKGVMERAELDKNDKKQYAYFQGLQIGGQIENMAKSFANDYFAGQQGKSVDTSIVASGVLAGLLGKSDMSVDAANTEFQNRMRTHREEQNAKAKTEGDAKQKAFLDENRQKEGVKETASGLQYKVLTEGNGPVPVATDKVKVNYEGHLIDGTEFDSSYKRNEPATFAANQVIKGWTEALCMMPVGSKWELYIPYELAYGERAAGAIPPYSTLIFTVELLSIEK